MDKRNIVLFLLVSVIFIIIIISLLLFNLNKNSGGSLSSQNVYNYDVVRTSINDINLDTIKANSSEIKISPNCIITFFKTYKGCGHTIKEKTFTDSDMVNLTLDDFKNLYSDWQINKFTSSDIELAKDFNGSCNEHFLVRSNDGYVCIYTIKDDNSIELKEKTDIAVKYLSLVDMNELENGVTLFGKDNLNSYIENFE